jgi:hypothetical protein
MGLSCSIKARNPMTFPPNTDIYHFAHILLREHRATACLEALRQEETMFRQGDMAGCLVWRRIAHMVERIHRMEQKTDMAM